MSDGGGGRAGTSRFCSGRGPAAAPGVRTRAGRRREQPGAALAILEGLSRAPLGAFALKSARYAAIEVPISVQTRSKMHAIAAGLDKINIGA